MRKGQRSLIVVFITYGSLFLVINFTILIAFADGSDLTGSYSLIFWIPAITFLLLTLGLFILLTKLHLNPLARIRQYISSKGTATDLPEPVRGPIPDFFNGMATELTQLGRIFQENVKARLEIETLSATIMKTTQLIILITDKTLRVQFINDFGHRSFKLSESEASGFDVSATLEKETLNQILGRLNDNSQVFHREAQLFLSEGRKIDANLFISILNSSANQPKRYLWIIEDITKTKLVELNLKNQISFSRQIFSTIPDMIIITDTNLKIIFTNQRAEKVLDDTSLVGKNINGILSKHSIENGFDQFLRNLIRRGEDSKQINVLHPFTETINYVDLVIEPLKTKAGVIGSLILIRDISEWRELTAKLRDLQSSMEKLIDASPNAIVSIDESDLISIWNTSTEKLLHVSGVDAVGKNLFDLIPGFAHYRDIINETRILNKTISLYDESVHLQNHSRIISNFTFYPIQSEEDRHVVIHIEDVSTIKKLEDSLVQAQKMEALGFLTSGIIHDFNNVLSGIVGYASLLDKRIPQDHELRKYVANLLIASEQATALIRQVMEFSKKKLTRNRLLNINEVIEESLGFIRLNIKNIAIKNELSDKKIWINADKTKLSQIVINLIINAKDALAGHPEPIIIIKSEEISIENHDSLANGSYAQIYVSDNGQGIKPDHLNKIFEPFFTTKSLTEGTGMGLATVKEIIKGYLGDISVQSQYGVGTTFTIVLPSIPESAEATTESGTADQKRSFEGVALLIDDEEVIREIGGDMLQTLGIRCITARNGSEGIEIFSRQKEEVDLVILDVEMPGISGEKVYERLREIKPEIKILIASGYSKEYLETKIFKRKIHDFMPKPFQLSQLSNKLSRLFNHS